MFMWSTHAFSSLAGLEVLQASVDKSLRRHDQFLKPCLMLLFGISSLHCSAGIVINRQYLINEGPYFLIETLLIKQNIPLHECRGVSFTATVGLEKNQLLQKYYFVTLQLEMKTYDISDLLSKYYPGEWYDGNDSGQ